MDTGTALQLSYAEIVEFVYIGQYLGEKYNWATKKYNKRTLSVL